MDQLFPREEALHALALPHGESCIPKTLTLGKIEGRGRG